MNNNRKKTISTLLSIALLLSATCGLLKNEPFIKPEETEIESIQQLLEKNGKKRKLLPKKNM